MDAITKAAEVKTMSSVELVDVINEVREEEAKESGSKFTPIRHDNLKTKIAKVLGKAAPKFLGTAFYVANNAKHEQPAYHLPKREAELVVMSESYKVQARVYDRMTALEAVAAPAIDPMKALSDPAMMRGLLLTYTEKVLTLESTVQAQAPKVAALDRLATVSEGSFCIRDAAKTLQVQEKKLKQILIEKKWIYQRPMGPGLLAYSDRLQQGVMEHKMTHGEKKSDGTEWTSTQARITAKGMAKLAEMVGDGQGKLAGFDDAAGSAA